MDRARVHTDLVAIFKDPDNLGRVCLYGGAMRPEIFQAKDERYTG
jgi:hypothetical protein